MEQLNLEQRQSVRFVRPFKVTTLEEEGFDQGFSGVDVNLTGLSFRLPEADWFLPGQSLSLRIRNDLNGEQFELDSVQVVHLQPDEQGSWLCGCHITQISSEQLLAHHRLVMTDQATAQSSMAVAKLSEFDFDETASPLSQNTADFQEASMALSLAVAEAELNQQWVERVFARLDQLWQSRLPADQQLTETRQEVEALKQAWQELSLQARSWNTLAKLLVHSPSAGADQADWQRLIADFEGRFLTDAQQMAYDLMHQGHTAREALEMAQEAIAQSAGGRTDDKRSSE
ncbi:PilZ domain-containing protein [Thiomicrospira sp. WB1]|uniref:PilZ domain-containing protein n=1 Tax=Thiomicrospira sp. WB1 TaxID=1685380 RepID=UPI00074A576B|nr:PilZ domain-containing protein [Thiomicrospira sp. WB1]KUJ72241.1 hypothetical protein AVO41_07005 [Thiomicrospira sp. WB1]